MYFRLTPEVEKIYLEELSIRHNKEVLFEDYVAKKSDDVY